jgi:hypothetical protein
MILRKIFYIELFYDEGEFPMAKELALELRDKINCSGFVSSVYKF